MRIPLAAIALALAAACSASAGNPDGGPAPTARAALAAPGPVAARRLVFFMNPYGAPCQMQDRVLRDMAPELSGKAALVYYRTTEQADLAQFGRYGVRSLPQLLVTDGEGREVRRATPGIHGPEEVRQLLAP